MRSLKALRKNKKYYCRECINQRIRRNGSNLCDKYFLNIYSIKSTKITLARHRYTYTTAYAMNKWLSYDELTNDLNEIMLI